MLDLSLISGLNPYYKDISYLNLRIKKITSTSDSGSYGENVNKNTNDILLKSKGEYYVSEAEKTDFEKYVGTIIDEAA